MKSWLKSIEMCKDVTIIVNIVYQPIIINIYQISLWFGTASVQNIYYMNCIQSQTYCSNYKLYNMLTIISSDICIMTDNQHIYYNKTPDRS